jgi:glutamate mutase epsilon subunit
LENLIGFIYILNNDTYIINMNNEQKAQKYNDLLFLHGRVTEKIRLIKADKFDLTEQDIAQIRVLENEQRKIMVAVERLLQS